MSFLNIPSAVGGTGLANGLPLAINPINGLTQIPGQIGGVPIQGVAASGLPQTQSSTTGMIPLIPGLTGL